MKCLKCQAENPETKKFCNECGAKLSKICPQCGSEILPTDKFCGECGHQLSLPSKPVPKELSFDEKLNKIQKYLPGGLTEKILAQRGKIEGERKQVTVMFTDMEGFTFLANVRILDAGPLDFGDIDLENLAGFGPVPNPPGYTLGMSTFSGNLTINKSFTYDSVGPHTGELLLDAFVASYRRPALLKRSEHP